MSQEEKDAVIGRVAREKAESAKQVTLLRAEAGRIGRLFKEVGNRLETEPEYVVFHGVSTDTQYCRLDDTIFDLMHLDSRQVVKLTTDLRDAVNKLKRLQKEAADLGI